MTRLTAMIIQSRGNDIQTSAFMENKMWSGCIDLYKHKEYDRVLLSSEPVFNTKKEAIDKMKEVIKEVRLLEL